MTAQPTTPSLPRVASRSSSGVAPLRRSGFQQLHLVLFVAGAVLLPLGLVVIGLGWYGVAHTPYAYDQMSYLVSGGILGLGITFVGGFLYFGAWLARVAADQKEAQARLGDTLLLLADAVAHAATGQAGVGAAGVGAASGRVGPVGGSGASAAHRDAADVLVTVGNSSTLHRAGCDLLAGREDVKVAGPDAGAHLSPCRLCLGR
jgi:hypothetical protein